MHIDEIQCLTGADTPGKAVEAVRTLVLGYPGDEPPDTDRIVLVEFDNGLFSVGWFDGKWRDSILGVTRWWELPPGATRKRNE